MKYDELYYTSNNYSDYFERSSRYYRLAEETTDLLQKINLMDQPILDYGCATGMLLDGLSKCGYKECYGYDISEWAVEKARQNNLNVSSVLKKNNYKVGYFLDVLEHIEEDNLMKVFDVIDCKTIIFRVPVVEYEGGDYVLSVSRRDKTHVIKWTKNQWKIFLENFKYFVIPINLYTIYDSLGVFAGIGIKK